MHPTPYSELNDVLACLAAGIQAAIGSNLIGVYLQGSFAVGDFDEHSDVDFIVALEDELAPAQVDRLQEVHAAVYAHPSEWARHLEGSYFPREILRDAARRGAKLWYLEHGDRSLIRSDHCNSRIVRWVVREKGVVVCGPPPRTLVDPIDADEIREEIFRTMVDWGREILEDPDRFRNRFYQGFILLSYCRMLHDLHNGHPGSKRQGAEWAKAAFDSSWSALIDRAWATRPDPARSSREPADPEDFEATLRFVEFALAEGGRSRARAGRPKVATCVVPADRAGGAASFPDGSGSGRRRAGPAGDA